MRMIGKVEQGVTFEVQGLLKGKMQRYLLIQQWTKRMEIATRQNIEAVMLEHPVGISHQKYALKLNNNFEAHYERYLRDPNIFRMSVI